MLVALKKFSPIIVALAALIFIGAGCTKDAGITPQRVNLSYWRVFDDSSTIEPIIQAYKALHPSVKISYKKLRIEEYERELLEGFAEDRGPDIFSIPNTWVGMYQSKLTPMPAQLTQIPTAVQSGKDVIIQNSSRSTPSTRVLKDNFVPTVVKDVVKDDQVYGLPLFVDTLALFYNRDLLARAGIPEPPRTWSEIQEMVPNLTVTTAQGDLLQSGIALGTADNVSRSSDILSLLMLQSGVKIVDENNRVGFSGAINRGEDNLAVNALLYYTDFANDNKTVYTWNDTQAGAVTAFAQGRVAMMLGYSYHLPQIQQKNPRINMGVVAAPQITETEIIPANIANYWIEVASKKTEYPHLVWDFILFSVRQDQAIKYLEATKRPTALRALIRDQQADLDLKPFADSLLVAESWYKGNNAQVAEEALKNAITITLDGTETADRALTNAARTIQDTLK